jgi:hypothetical protein
VTRRQDGPTPYLYRLKIFAVRSGVSGLARESTGTEPTGRRQTAFQPGTPAAPVGGEHVNISKDKIVQFLKDKGQSQQADQAGAQLPDQVDSDKHADLLAKFGIEPKELLDKVGGSLGNVL